MVDGQVVWHNSQTDFVKRYEKYLDPTFFQHRIHWFSIFNSFMMVLFLVGLVTMIMMRTLRKVWGCVSDSVSVVVCPCLCDDLCLCVSGCVCCIVSVSVW